MRLKLEKDVRNTFPFMFILLLLNLIINHTNAGKHLGHITETDDEWTLELDVGHSNSATTSVAIDNNRVHITGRYRRDGVWHNINESYTIPKKFKDVSNNNVNGKIKIVAKNCKGDCPWDKDGWPFPPNYKWPWDGNSKWPFN